MHRGSVYRVFCNCLLSGWYGTGCDFLALHAFYEKLLLAQLEGDVLLLSGQRCDFVREFVFSQYCLVELFFNPLDFISLHSSRVHQLLNGYLHSLKNINGDVTHSLEVAYEYANKFSRLP